MHTVLHMHTVLLAFIGWDVEGRENGTVAEAAVTSRGYWWSLDLS